MKQLRSIIYAGLLLCASAQAEVSIREVGLAGYVARGPSRATIRVTNPSPSPQEFTVRLMWRNEDDRPHTDYKVRLNGGESRDLDADFYYSGDYFKLFVEQINVGGDIVSRAEKEVAPVSGTVVAVVCGSTPVCTAVAQGVHAGHTIEETNNREQAFRVVLVENPPQSWVAYTPATWVVVAGPVTNPSARAAIEDYVRRDGRAVIAEDQAPRDLLAGYRTSSREPVAVGHGSVIFLPHAATADIQEVFREKTAPAPTTPNVNFSQLIFTQEMNEHWLLGQFGTRFNFPSLRWLIASIAAYTVLIGIVNFMILRRIRRVELSWITVPALALVFAVVFYAFGTVGRSTRFGLDEVSVSWMDDHSARGALSQVVRVVSPRVRDISLEVPISWQLNNGEFSPLFRASDVADVWNERARSRSDDAPEITNDSAQHIRLLMLRFSFRDLDFQGFRDFPGTVHLDHGRLKNSTGQNFREAVLVDFQAKQFYDLGPLADGAEVDPFAGGAHDISPRYAFLVRNRASSFTLAEAVRLWRFHTNLPESYFVFMGLTDQPLLQAQLEGISPQRKTYTLFSVKIGRPR